MLDHIGFPVSDFAASREFYTRVLATLGYSLVLEVERAREFSPVKNASGVDSPATTRADICRLHAHFAARAGWEIPPHGPEGYPLVEIDPLLGEEPEHFEAHGPRVPRRTDRGVFYE